MSATTVCVCIATYRRPQMLSETLAALTAQMLPADGGVQVQVAVADNDPEGSAATVVSTVAAAYPFPLHYEVEKRRGISHARNRLLAMVPDGTQFVVFVDDDELPEPQWLQSLLAAQRAGDADVALGPVLSKLPAATPACLIPYFDRRRYPTGTAVGDRDFRCGNVLLRREFLVHALGSAPFDAEFALTGGEDSLLGAQLARAGARFVWADDAIVWETVPETRTSVRWLASRAFRCGSCVTAIRRKLRTSGFWLVERIVKMAGLVAWGSALVILGLVRGRATVIRGWLAIARGSGGLAALVGRPYREYEATHGS